MQEALKTPKTPISNVRMRKVKGRHALQTMGVLQSNDHN